MTGLCWCSDFLVNSVCARDLSLLNIVKYDCSVISYTASWQVDSFSIYANYLICAVTVFTVVLNYLLVQFQFQKKSELLSCAATVFYRELILHKYSVEGYVKTKGGLLSAAEGDT